MLRPAHLASPSPSPLTSRRSLAAAIGVGLIHLLFFYALLSGLATRAVQSLPNIIDVRILESAQPKQVELPPPAPLPDLAQPKLDIVPPPQIRIEASASPAAITVEQKSVPATPPRAAKPAPVAVAPKPTPAVGIEHTHTTPPYPPLSRRLGEEGTVELKIVIAPDGRVQSAELLKSSGSERLDEAALTWVRSHWRYRPATRDGRPVSSETRVNVVFNLKISR